MIIDFTKHLKDASEEERKEAMEKIESAQKDCVEALEMMLEKAKAGEFAAVNICAVMGAWFTTPEGQEPPRAVFLPTGTDGIDAGLCTEPFFTPLLGAISYSNESIMNAMRPDYFHLEAP